MVEVGTTNRCRLSDYEKALTKYTAAIFKVHPSNYKILGFTESVEVDKLSKLAHSKGIPCFYDWGSGSFYKFQQSGLSQYTTVEQELTYSPDLLAFSGDKLLGGIQTGIHWFPAHKLTFFKNSNCKLPVTDEIESRILTLPLHPDLTDEDINIVCNNLKDCIESFA